MAGIHGHAGGLVDGTAGNGFEKGHRIADRTDDTPVFLFQRRVAGKIHIPVFRMMQIGKPTIDQRANKIQGQRSFLVAFQHQFRVRGPLFRREPDLVDQITTKGGQGNPIACLGVGRTRLGVLAGNSSHPNQRLFEPVQQDQAHLHQDFQFLCDQLRIAFIEALRAVTALQQKSLATLRFGQLRFEALDLPGSNQRRQAAQARQYVRDLVLVGIGQHLARCPILPARRVPV